MRSLSCYHRSPFLCEYLINALTVTQPDVRPMHFILKCPLQDSRGGHSLGCRGHSLPRHEHEICDCCSVRNLATLNKAISPTFGMGIRSLSFPCPTFGHDAQPLMTLFSVVLPALVRKPHLYAKGVWQISGFRLTVATLSGSVSKAHHFIDKFRDGVDECTYPFAVCLRVHSAAGCSDRNVDFPLYQDLLLFITNEPISTLHSQIIETKNRDSTPTADRLSKSTMLQSKCTSKRT